MRPQSPADASALIGLLTFASAALPVGTFVYSDGLESAVAAGNVTGEASLLGWLQENLACGGAAIEAAIFARVHEACVRKSPEEVSRWDAELTAQRDAAELRAQSRSMGAALRRLLCARPEDRSVERFIGDEANYATVAACAFALLGTSRLDGTIAYLHAWATHMVVSGAKLIPLGQTSAHCILRDLTDPIVRCAQRASDLEDQSIFEQCAWGASLAAMQHEVLYTRLFKS